MTFAAEIKAFELGDAMVGLNPQLMGAIVGSELANVKHNQDKLVMIK